MKKYIALFTNGLLKENPLLTLMIGLCSSLAVTTAVSNGIGMGLAMTFVLLMSGGLQSLQIASIAAAAPFAVIMVIACWCLWKALKKDEATFTELN